jgi:multidrug transporter EmrE-like cation transporter
MKLLLAVFPTVVCIIYSQLMTKWRVGHLAQNLAESRSILDKIFVYLSDPLIISAYLMTFVGSVGWVFVVERYPISSAFPVYIGSIVVFVTLGGVLLFNEILSFQKLIAMTLIIIGVYLVSRT